ncbi:hypothetical protein DFH09DRAFT_1358712 [Mycena vulgaris]|nr:hypothetical protein DFH09DRAFT_1358712 [Mycena vulgaris]
MRAARGLEPRTISTRYAHTHRDPTATSGRICALVFTTQAPRATEFICLFNAAISDHFYTTNATEGLAGGYAVENPAQMYLYPTQLCGSVPLYRSYSEIRTHHFYTADAVERDQAASSGYVYQLVAGYVFPPPTNTSGIAPTASNTSLSSMSDAFSSPSGPRTSSYSLAGETSRPTATHSTPPKSKISCRGLHRGIVPGTTVTLLLGILLCIWIRKRLDLELIPDSYFAMAEVDAGAPVAEKSRRDNNDSERGYWDFGMAQLRNFQAQLESLQSGGVPMQQNETLTALIRVLERELQSQVAAGSSEQPPPGYLG